MSSRTKPKVVSSSILMIRNDQVGFSEVLELCEQIHDHPSIEEWDWSLYQSLKSVLQNLKDRWSDVLPHCKLSCLQKHRNRPVAAFLIHNVPDKVFNHSFQPYGILDFKVCQSYFVWPKFTNYVHSLFSKFAQLAKSVPPCILAKIDA